MSTPEPYPSHLYAVPGEGEQGQQAVAEPPPSIVPGLTPPRHRGHSRGMITDVLVELGYLTQEAVDVAIEQARISGLPPENLLLEQGQIDAEQLTRAIAERYGLDHVDLSMLPGGHGRRGALPGRDGAPLQGGAGRLHRPGHADGRDRRSGQRARRRRRPDRNRPRLPDRGRDRGGHRGAPRSPGHDAERRGRRDHRGTRRGGRRGGRGRHRRRNAGQRRRRPGRQAGLQHPRPGGRGGRLRHPPRARRGRAAGPLPRRRRAQGVRPRAAPDDQRRDLAAEDHERARHRREARAPGRQGQRQRRGPTDRSARDHPADPARRGGDDQDPRRKQRRTHARRPRHGSRRPGALRARLHERPTERSWSPARPARGRARPSTPPSRS